MQCSILQGSAATEEYIKAIFDAWVFNLSRRDEVKSVHIPIRIRSLMAKSKLEPSFSRYVSNSDERELLHRLAIDTESWVLMSGDAPIPRYFAGSSVYMDKKYPSEKNIKAIFYRIGIDNPMDRLSAIMKADAEYSITAFNSIRTALAHESPPSITYNDVIENLDRIRSLVRAIDRLLFFGLKEASKIDCWPKR